MRTYVCRCTQVGFSAELIARDALFLFYLSVRWCFMPFYAMRCYYMRLFYAMLLYDYSMRLLYPMLLYAMLLCLALSIAYQFLSLADYLYFVAGIWIPMGMQYWYCVISTAFYMLLQANQTKPNRQILESLLACRCWMYIERCCWFPTFKESNIYFRPTPRDVWM